MVNGTHWELDIAIWAFSLLSSLQPTARGPTTAVLRADRLDASGDVPSTRDASARAEEARPDDAFLRADRLDSSGDVPGIRDASTRAEGAGGGLGGVFARRLDEFFTLRCSDVSLERGAD